MKIKNKKTPQTLTGGLDQTFLFIDEKPRVRSDGNFELKHTFRFPWSGWSPLEGIVLN